MPQNDEFDPELSSALAKMADAEESLPAGLEDRVVLRLRNKKMVGPRTAGWQRRVWAALAAAIVFSSGILLGRVTSPNSSADYSYVLLLKEGTAFHRAAGVEETQHRIAEYRQWAIDLRSRGIPISGLKLSERSISVGVASSSELDVAGLFTIRTDEETARRIAASCPHLRYGGSVIIRPIVKT